MIRELPCPSLCCLYAYMAYGVCDVFGQTRLLNERNSATGGASCLS